MLIRHLIESPEIDLQHSLTVEAIITRMRRHVDDLIRNGGSLPTVRFRGKDVPGIVFGEITTDKLFSDVLVIFPYTDGYGGNGQAIAREDKKFPYLVSIDCLGEDLRSVYRTISAPRTTAVLTHELHHIIDMKRHKGDIFASSRTVKADTRDKPRDPVEYHNSASELNAFANNIAEPILQRMRAVTDMGPEGAHIYDDLPKNFMDFYNQIVSRLYGAEKRHLQNLTQYNRRKLMKRLFLLFRYYEKMLDDDHTDK